MRALDLFVGQSRRTPHQAAAEPMADLVPFSIDSQLDEQAPTVLARPQAAPAVGQRFGQHRYDAVREIYAVATGPRHVIERGPRSHVVRNVSNGHDHAKA